MAPRNTLDGVGSETTTKRSTAATSSRLRSDITTESVHPPEMKLADLYSPSDSFVEVDNNQMHWLRRVEIVKKHPEVKKLFGPDRMSVLWVFALPAFVTALAYVCRDASWWTVFAVAYVFAATADHALWVLIHEGTHNLLCKSQAGNQFLLCVCNLPHVIPSALSFRYYHRLHHAHLNEAYDDPDLPGPAEAEFFGNSSLGKIVWLALFPLLQTARTLRYRRFIVNRWLVLNWVANTVYSLCVFETMGFKALVFLFAASMFSIGLHPAGARWIAEHWAVAPPQETYSYYGVFNKFAFNIGYHNEHHDLPDVAWSRLPALKAAAPEFYDNLVTHSSYVGLLWQFFFDPKFNLRSRVVRRSKKIQDKLHEDMVHGEVHY